MLLCLIHRHREHGDLQTCHIAAQEVETGTGDLHTALHIDAGDLLAEGEVVFRLEALGCEIADLTDLPHHHVVVFAAFRRLWFHDVRQLPHRGGVLFVGGVGACFERGDLFGELLGLRDQLRLLIRCGLGDLLADLLLAGAGLFELLERGAAFLVGTEHLVDEFDGFAAFAL